MLDLWGLVAMLEDLKPGRLSDCREETPSSDERGLRRLTSFSQIQSRLWSAYGSRDSLSDAYMEHSR